MIDEYSAPTGFPMIRGITRKNQRITMTSGIERIKSTYIAEAVDSGPRFDSRARASSVPMTIPPLIAIRVRWTLNWRPVQMKGRLGTRTVVSNWPIVLPFRLLLRRRDVAGYPRPVLDPDHQAIGDERADEVENGDGQVGLDPLLGVLLHLAGLERELQHADGECHGGVLEDVHEFRGERREDDPERHGQEDMAVGLRPREPHGEPGEPLPPGKAQDPRLHLLGDARGGEQAQADRGGDELLGGPLLLDPEGELLRQEL